MYDNSPTYQRVLSLMERCSTVNSVLDVMQYGGYPEDGYSYLSSADVQGHKICLVKRVREIGGIGLKEAKDIVEAAQANPDWRWEGPQPKTVSVPTPVMPEWLLANITATLTKAEEGIQYHSRTVEALRDMLTNGSVWNDNQSEMHRCLNSAVQQLGDVLYSLNVAKTARVLP
jgi:hypothetical protein